MNRIRCRPGNPGRPAGDAGETLIELLVAVVVIGTAVVAILGALVVAVDSSTLARNQTRVQAALRSWAEQVTAVGDTGTYRYVPCAAAATFPDPATLPTGFVPSKSVQYWTGSTWSGTCTTDAGVQRVTLRIEAPGHAWSAVTQSVDVVVRRPCAAESTC